MKTSLIPAVAVAACCATAAVDAATVNATRSSDNVIQGRFESGAANTYLTDNSNARRVGTGGAGTDTRVNQPVLGFNLPAIPAGDTVSAATFEITLDAQAINQSNAFPFDMVVSLMGGATQASFSGADFVEVPGPAGLGAGNALVGSRDHQDADIVNNGVVSFALTGDALTQLAGLYDASGNPTQAEVFFRLSTSDPVITDTGINNAVRFNLARNGSPLQVTRSLTIETVPEPSSAIALIAVGATLLRRRRA